MSEELKQRIRIAITDKQTAEELIAVIEGLLSRVTALENP